MKNLTFLALHDKYQVEYLFKYPFRYVIQLWSGAKKDHCAFLIDGFVYEWKFSGLIVTEYHNWLQNLDPQTTVSAYEFLKESSSFQISEGLKYLNMVNSKARYCIIEYLLSKIPLFKKIRFKEDSLMFCNKIYLRLLQVLSFISSDIYCAAYDVDKVPDLLGNLLGGRQDIK